MPGKNKKQRGKRQRKKGWFSQWECWLSVIFGHTGRGGSLGEYWSPPFAGEAFAREPPLPVRPLLLARVDGAGINNDAGRVA